VVWDTVYLHLYIHTCARARTHTYMQNYFHKIIITEIINVSDVIFYGFEKHTKYDKFSSAQLLICMLKKMREEAKTKRTKHDTCNN